MRAERADFITMDESQRYVGSETSPLPIEDMIDIRQWCVSAAIEMGIAGYIPPDDSIFGAARAIESYLLKG